MFFALQASSGLSQHAGLVGRLSLASNPGPAWGPYEPMQVDLEDLAAVAVAVALKKLLLALLCGTEGACLLGFCFVFFCLFSDVVQIQPPQ